jgi:hypothetical protein
VCPTNEGVLVTLAMAIGTKSYTVRNRIPQYRVCGKRFDVVWMKAYCFSVPLVVVCAAILTGVAIALENGSAPSLVFIGSTGEVVLMGCASYAIIVGFLTLVHLTDGFLTWRMQDGATLVGTCLSELATLAVFGHRLFADRTWHTDGAALGAYLIVVVAVLILVAAHLAYNASAAHISSEARGTCNASGTPGWRAGSGDCGYRLTTLCARDRPGSMTVPTNCIICALTADHTASVKSSHSVPSLPHLAALVKFTLERLTGMGLEAHLIK